MKIIKCLPVFKDYLWGGEQMKNFYPNMNTPTPLAESWLLSANKDGESVVCGGEYDGTLFGEYLNDIGKDALGKNATKFDFFPVLIKFIDAKLPLSIQVHPDDAYAMEHEKSYGKTEMWYIVDAAEDAFIYYGLSQDLSKQEFESSIKNNSLTNYLNKIPVKNGDCFFIPSGTIHAIGAGTLIAEVQQNSNITYRVYDYGRKDKDGNTRELHIDKAVDVTTLTKLNMISQSLSNTEPDVEDNIQPLASCDYFNVERIIVDGHIELSVTDDSFQNLICVDGEATIKCENQTLSFSKGESIFIPAQDIKYELIGQAVLLKTTV